MGNFAKVFAVLVIVASGAVGCARVVIDDPANGSFINDTSTTISGQIFSTDPEGNPIDILDTSLEINGVSVPLAPDGSYTTTVALDQADVFNAIEADIIELSTGFVDSDRIVVIAGDSIADGDFSPESIALQINSSGLDALQPVVSGLVDLDLPTLLPVGSVVINNVCLVDGPFGLCLGRGTISIDNPAPSISNFGVDFDSETDRVHTVINLSNFDLNVYIDGSGLVPNCDLNLMASNVSLAGDYALEPDSANASRVDVAQQGSVSTMFANFDQTFTSGICDTFLIGDIIQLILGDVEPLVRSGLEGFLNNVDGDGNTVIAAAIETALAGVDISGPVGLALNSDLDAPLFQVKETTSGITLGSDARFVTNFGTGPGECTPPAGAPDLAASYHVAQPFPSWGSTAPSGAPYDVGLGISSSGFNQLLRSMVECGLLVATIEEIDLLGTGTPLPLSAGLLAAFVPPLSIFPADSPARIEIAPTMAPLITGEPGPAGELALLKIAQLSLKVMVSVTNPNTLEVVEVEAADLFLDADVGINLSFDAGTGGLAFELAEPSPSDITVKSVENPLGADLTDVEDLLPFVVGSFLPALAGGLGGFPLPSFLGLNLDVVEVTRNQQMLTIYADLAAAP